LTGYSYILPSLNELDLSMKLCFPQAHAGFCVYNDGERDFLFPRSTLPFWQVCHPLTLV
jgi:hypothetical protein